MIELRKAREIAMQVLFQWEAQGLLQKKNTDVPEIFESLEIDQALSQYLRSFYDKDQSTINTQFAAKLILGVVWAVDKIDDLIDRKSSNWKLARMDAIDRAVLRVAVYELAIKGELAPAIIINEAVEIAKKYGSENSASFINGILDTIKVI